MIVLRAKWVVPISSAPILNGEVEVDGSKITYCGVRRENAKQSGNEQPFELGDSIILPGFINRCTGMY
jgi:cytosine/adenosine deaminase-related metal-dependent hydrolase